MPSSHGYRFSIDLFTRIVAGLSRARARARDPFVARVRALRHRCVRTKTRYSARSRSWPSETPISYNFRPPGVYYRNPQFQLETANARARYLTVHVHAQVSARVNSALVEEDVLPRHLTSFPRVSGGGRGEESIRATTRSHADSRSRECTNFRSFRARGNPEFSISRARARARDSTSCVCRRR